MNKNHFLLALVAVFTSSTGFAADGLLFGARDESPAPFPQAKIADFLPYASFLATSGSAATVAPRFFLVDAAGKSIPDLDGMGGIFRTRYIAKTLSGARTIVFVRYKTEQAGQWVASFTNEKVGQATSIEMEAYCIDMATPSVHVLLKGDALPLNGVSKEPFRWKSKDDGKVYRTGQYRPGLLLQELLEDIIK